MKKTQRNNIRNGQDGQLNCLICIRHELMGEGGGGVVETRGVFERKPCANACRIYTASVNPYLCSEMLSCFLNFSFLCIFCKIFGKYVKLTKKQVFLPQ